MTEQLPSDPLPPSKSALTDGAAPAAPPETAADVKRVVIPIVVLGVVALAAIAFGVMGRRGTDSGAATAGSTVKASTSVADRSSSTVAPSPTTAVTTASPAAVSTAPTPDCGQWPASYFASPVVAGTGAYLWAENGWHLRIVSERPQTVGAILSTAGDLKPEAFTLTDPKAGRLEVRANVMAFRMDADSTIKGIDFLMPCPISEFELRIQGADGKLWPVAQIGIGYDHKAIANPFTTTRLR